MLERLYALPPSLKSIELELKIEKEIHAITGLHSQTINHNNKNINVQFVGISGPQQDAQLMIEPKEPEQLPAVIIEPWEPVKYTLKDFPEGEDQDPPEDQEEPPLKDLGVIREQGLPMPSKAASMLQRFEP